MVLRFWLVWAEDSNFFFFFSRFCWAVITGRKLTEGGVSYSLRCRFVSARLGNVGYSAVPRHRFKPVEHLALSITARNSTIHDITMAELAFAKSFLSALDPKPIKLRADYVLPPEQVDLRGPVRHHTHPILHITPY